MIQMSIVAANHKVLGVYSVKSLDEAKAIVAGTEKAVAAAVAEFDGNKCHTLGSYYDGKWCYC